MAIPKPAERVRQWCESQGFTVEGIWRDSEGWRLHCLDSNARLHSYLFQGRGVRWSIFKQTLNGMKGVENV